MLFSIFGITDSSLNLVVSLLLLFLAVAWLALAWWAYQDAKQRTKDPVLIGSAVVACLLFPFAGALLYSIVRPPEFLSDIEERDLELAAASLRVKHLTETSCPRCQFPLERMFLRCPECQTRVKDPCPSCSKPVDRRWSLCPYCETRLRRRGEQERRPAPRKRTGKTAGTEGTPGPDGGDAASPAKPQRRQTAARQQARD